MMPDTGTLSTPNPAAKLQQSSAIGFGRIAKPDQPETIPSEDQGFGNSAKPSPATDEPEFSRRLRWLTNRAKRVKDGRLECRFCLAAVRRIRQHLRVNHREQIMQLSAGDFT